MPSCFSRIELPRSIANWLLYEGSFTEKAKSLLPQEKLTIELIRQDLTLRSNAFAHFKIPFICEAVYQREIKIYLGKFLLMFARSTVPKDADLFFKRKFRALGLQPLGQMLFNDSRVSRSQFEVAKIRPDHTDFNSAVTNRVATDFLWARQSLFSQGKPLLSLTEIFSPDLIELIHEQNKSSET